MSQPFGISCRGGLNTNLNELEILSTPGSARILQNFEVDPDGGYRKVKGYTPFGGESAVKPGGDTTILGVEQYGEGVVVVVDDAVYYSDDGTAWIQVNKNTTSGGMNEATLAGATVLTRSGQGQAQFSLMLAPTGYTDNPFGSLTIATGTNKLANFRIEGTNPATRLFFYEELTTPAAGTYVENHDLHLCVVDTENAPNTIYYSATQSDTDFVGAGSGAISTTDRITGIKAFRDDLFVFTNNSIMKLVNINDAASISLQPVTHNVGCVSGYSIQEIGGDLIYLSPDGLRTIAGTVRIDDVELSSASRQIQEIVSDVASRVNSYVISSGVLRGKSQYRLYYYTQGLESSASSGIIGTLVGDSFEWSTTKGIQASAFCSTLNYQGIEKLYHGDDKGYIYNHDTGNYFMEDGVQENIPAIYETPSFDFGDLGTRKTLKYVKVSFSPEGNVSPSLRLRYDYDSEESPQPLDYTFSNIPAPSVFGTAIFGSDVFGGSSDPAVRQAVEGSGYTCSLRISSDDISAPYAVNGIYIDYMPSGRR